MEFNMTEGYCTDALQKFKLDNEEFLKNNIVLSFLKNKDHEDLFVTAICNPTIENEKKLDNAFRKFYFHIRFISFISTAIYFNAVNFDKKHRKIQQRHPLTVDRPLGNDEDGTFKDLITDEKAQIHIDHIIQKESILDYLEDPQLCSAVEKLTEKQKEIINLAFVNGLSDTQIGKILNKSQQSVSKTRKKAIQNIIQSFKGGKNSK
ncbi:sigma-70 family RNA polymerase sigma factor [Rummeliibacillus sp. BSL5]